MPLRATQNSLLRLSVTLTVPQSIRCRFYLLPTCSPQHHRALPSCLLCSAATGRHVIGLSLYLQEPAIAAATLLPPAPSSIPELSAVTDRHVIVDSLHHQDPVIAAANLSPPAAVVVLAAEPIKCSTGARNAMHAYFAQFAGCHNRALEVVPVAAEDADLLDLRKALPPMQWPPQFLDLEAVHVDAFLGDSSGRSMDSFSGSNSLASFIDDAPVEISAIDIASVAQFVADVLPITAEILRLPDLSPATVAASKRRRRVVSSTSSSPPKPSLSGGSRRRVAASLSPSPPAQAPIEE